MSTQAIVYLLTALAAVVVVLTRLRLGRNVGAVGRFGAGQRLLTLHTAAGVLALVTWLVFLVADEDAALGSSVVGIVGLAFWWVTVVAGLLVLVRWLPTRGRHASPRTRHPWSKGPGLSFLAHVGLLAGVCVFTWTYLTAAV